MKLSLATISNNKQQRPPIQGGFFNYSKPNTPHEKITGNYER